MKISELLTDNVILAEIGERIARRRLDLQLTQADVAEQAGVSKRTLERIEFGAWSLSPAFDMTYILTLPVAGQPATR